MEKLLINIRCCFWGSFQVKSTLKGHSKRITGLAFSHVLNVLVSSGADSQVIKFHEDHLFGSYVSYFSAWTILILIWVAFKIGSIVCKNLTCKLKCCQYISCFWELISSAFFTIIIFNLSVSHDVLLVSNLNWFCRCLLNIIKTNDVAYFVLLQSFDLVY